MTKSVLTLIASHDKEKVSFECQQNRSYYWLILPAILLLSCTTESSWIKKGSTREDYDRDTASCSSSARGAMNRNDLPSDAHNRINFCMMANGWQLVNTAEAEKLKNASPAQKEYLVNLKGVLDDLAVEKTRCDKKVFAKEIKSFVALSQCTNKNLNSIFERHHISGSGIPEKVRDRHMEIAMRLDSGQMTQQQAGQEMSAYVKQLLMDGMQVK